MNKKGFTLIELLAVVVILSIVIVLVVPQITNTASSSKKSVYKTKIAMIEDAAALYGQDNYSSIVSSCDDTNCTKVVTVSDLVNAGYVSAETNVAGEYISNPVESGSYLDNYEFTITINKNTRKVTAKYGTSSQTLKTLSSLNGINNKGNQSTSSFSSISTGSNLLYSTNDDYGTTYYYRGNVTKNYVYFAGYYWRIIRINGDGSIRLIYDGTSAYSNGSSSTNKRIKTSKFSGYFNNTKYLGYMYDSDSSSSIIKGVLDTWYEDNILGTEYEDYISDTLFCNDRSTTGSTYNAYTRIYSNKKPSLYCTNQEDAYTVGDYSYGNGSLTYPIGLITADEIVYAGGVYGTTNSSFYLYSGFAYWTMTPFTYSSSNIAYMFVGSNNSLTNTTVTTATTTTSGVRPVINLSAYAVTLLSGSGTNTSPFQIT